MTNEKIVTYHTTTFKTDDHKLIVYQRNFKKSPCNSVITELIIDRNGDRLYVAMIFDDTGKYRWAVRVRHNETFESIRTTLHTTR